MSTARRRVALAVAILAVALAGVSPASGEEFLGGTCILQLSADVDLPGGQSMEVTTDVSSVCAVNEGSGKVDLSGSLEPVVAGIQFTCRENVGEGSATLRFYAEPEDTEPTAVVEDVDFQASDVDGVVEATTVKQTAGDHLVGSFEGIRTPHVVQSCTEATDPVTWTGVYTFEMVV